MTTKQQATIIIDYDEKEIRVETPEQEVFAGGIKTHAFDNHADYVVQLAIPHILEYMNMNEKELRDKILDRIENPFLT